MSTPTWSICHATYGRPQKAVAAMRMWFERAARPDEVEYVVALNSNDPEYFEYTDEIRKMGTLRIRITEGMFHGSAPAWDAAAKASTGQWLIQASDDVVCEDRWDEKLAVVTSDATSPAFVQVDDGYRKDDLMCIAVCNRQYYEMAGEFIHAQFKSVWSDDDYSVRAYAAAMDGRATHIKARHIQMRHEHHYHNKAVPWDPVYARGNSTEAYAQGQALFMKRNSHLVARGLKTW